MRKPETLFGWLAEVAYIESIDREHPGTSFGGDPACFRRYVEMQASFAREDGFPLLADRMLAPFVTAGSAAQEQ